MHDGGLSEGGEFGGLPRRDVKEYLFSLIGNPSDATSQLGDAVGFPLRSMGV